MAGSERQQRAVEAMLAQESTSPTPAPAAPSVRSALRGPTKPTDSPASLIVIGLVVTLLGGVVVGVGIAAAGVWVVLAGALVGVIGQLMALVGVVAAGVRLGMQWRDFDRR